ncbi:hypothetical protein PHLCEN_2v10678 [Hermanssonia centrifuga]|uniref:Uncharacterized protein n=1 Tax=Hermanssonia centrifuga TaxID=98765 RepID=A0A2R6NM76_9APHY|nr:hypothetical protein PHLCEN_2v10678 [Hermanssonia centrifuga]
MPPKRKAPPVVVPESQPTKRATRTRNPLVATQPLANGPGRVTRSRAGLATKLSLDNNAMPSAVRENSPITITHYDAPTEQDRSADATKASPAPESAPESQPKTKKRRGRPPGKKAASRQPSLPHPSPPSSSKVTIEALQDLPHDPGSGSESDELNLLSRRKVSSRAVTPTRTHISSVGSVSGARATTPMRTRTPGSVFIEAVEITTPSRRLRDIPRNNASPSQRTLRNGLLSSNRNTKHYPPPGSPSRLVRRIPPILEATSEVDEEPVVIARPLIASLPEATSESDEDVIHVSHVPPEFVPITPRKGKPLAAPQASPSRLIRELPLHLHVCLQAQKRTSLKSLQNLSTLDLFSDTGGDEDETPTNAVAYEQLCDLLKGTIDRGEGNSCLLTGPRGSGKTHLLEKAISGLAEQPILIRLSGHVQTNDRLAIRELAWQLARQTGNSLLPPDSSIQDDSENPFLDSTEPAIALPPPAHLLALISMIPTLPRPTIIVLDAFDLFTLHARQSLLYCLLDTAQSCRAVKGNKGMAVIGVTTRVDTINMLEKRVKSRFSGRTLRTACPRRLIDWIRLAKAALCTPIATEHEEWSRLWDTSVEDFLQHQSVLEILKDTFALSRDLRMLSRLLISPIVVLKPSSPYLTASALATSASAQRCPSRFSFLSTLAYPALCLLVASVHARTSGHDIFTFEMLAEAIRDQIHASQATPVHVAGGSVTMMPCRTEVLVGAFEKLVCLGVFTPATAPAVGTGREFVRYRCTADRNDVKEVINKTGPLSLQKWFRKAQ